MTRLFSFLGLTISLLLQCAPTPQAQTVASQHAPRARTPGIAMPAVPSSAFLAPLSSLNLSKLEPTLPSLGYAPGIIPPGIAASPVLPQSAAQGSSWQSAPAVRAEDRPLRLILAGPPGSGKTTYGKRMASQLGLVHVSVGELLREKAKNEPALRRLMARGELADTALVLGVVQERLNAADARERGFVLDGFPRRMEEALPLESWFGEEGLDAVIRLEVPERELRRRVLARGRADDTEAAFKERMAIYRARTEPVLEHFDGRVPVLRPEVSGADADANFAGLLSTVLDFLKARKSGG